MPLEGFTPYKKEDADKYNRLRWWSGIPMGDFLDKAADIYPDKEALVDGEKRLTYAQLKNKTDKLAIGFIDLGIKPLDRVLVQLPNWFEFIHTYFALQKIGAVPILLLAKHRQNEINHLLRLTEELCKTKDGVIDVNMDDDAIRGLTVIKDGEITWPPPPLQLPVAPPPAKPAAAQAAPAKKSGHGHGAGEPASARSLAVTFGIGALLFWLVGSFAPASFLAHFTVFVLACFIGYMVIWNVTPALHTPLMSVTNAISSIIAVGALIQVAPPLGDATAGRPGTLILGLAVVALTLTAINMFGGFAVTRRMLAMFRK